MRRIDADKLIELIRREKPDTQEAVIDLIERRATIEGIAEKPIQIPWPALHSWAWGCPNCKGTLGFGMRFCPGCGREVAWE